MYIFIVIHFIINNENILHNYLQINTKLKHKELFKIWTQRKAQQHKE
jgi:ABC-type transporter Mla MlaB component